VESLLRDSVFRVDNLGDRDQDKLERLEARFMRVDAFLGYLAAEETAEIAGFGLAQLSGPLGREWVPSIRTQFVAQTDWIRRRVRENRERYAEDESIDVPEVEAESEFRWTVEDDDSLDPTKRGD
jgi:hypothetical protein